MTGGKKAWKTALYKKGDKYQAGNYRHVSLIYVVFSVGNIYKGPYHRAHEYSYFVL